MRRPLVAGNWKMNTTVVEGVELAKALCESVDGAAAEVALLPPFTHLAPLHEVLRHSSVRLGAQDVFWEQTGAYTGEVSARMLAGLCEYVLVGHSERRHLLGETDEQVGRKLASALAGGLRVIVAVGEQSGERDAGQTFTVVERQLRAALVPRADAWQPDQLVIAYEPVWAIGTGRTATAEQAQEACSFIRGRVGRVTDAASVRVLYGGSVMPDNAASLFAQPDVDGALVGGASLQAAQFAAIVAAASAGAEG